MTENAGNTQPAGAGVSDDELVESVNEQTDSDLEHSDFFKREADGATTDTEAAKATADEVADEG